MLAGTYDGWLVIASLLMAMLASYTALDMAGRVASAQGRAARWWLAGGSVAMGIGIWSMHFLGMLAFRLPISMGYDPTITLFSLPPHPRPSPCAWFVRTTFPGPACRSARC